MYLGVSQALAVSVICVLFDINGEEAEGSVGSVCFI